MNMDSFPWTSWGTSLHERKDRWNKRQVTAWARTLSSAAYTHGFWCQRLFIVCARSLLTKSKQWHLCFQKLIRGNINTPYIWDNNNLPTRGVDQSLNQSAKVSIDMQKYLLIQVIYGSIDNSTIYHYRIATNRITGRQSLCMVTARSTAQVCKLVLLTPRPTPPPPSYTHTLWILSIAKRRTNKM